MLCDNSRKQMTRNQRQRLDVYDRHFPARIGIAFRKRSAVAESGVIDQEIHFEFLAIKLLEESLQLSKISKIDLSDMNKKLRMLSSKLISKLDQFFITSCDQNHRASAAGELTRKLTTDAG